MRIIGGEFARAELFAPKGLATRPSASRLRESLFNICQTNIEGSHFLDLFAGSGAVGIEALSRGAFQATFIEKGKDAIQALKKNISKFRIENQTLIIPKDVFQALDRMNGNTLQFDFIFADPPYGQNVDGDPIPLKLLQTLDQNQLLKNGGRFFLEEEDHRLEQWGESLQNLSLKSKRKVGRAYLYEWVAH